MSNQVNLLEQLGEQFDKSIHGRIQKINSEMTFAPTKKQIDRLRHLEAKFLIKIRWDEVKTMVIASEKIKAILRAVELGEVQLRTRPLVREIPVNSVVRK